VTVALQLGPKVNRDQTDTASPTNVIMQARTRSACSDGQMRVLKLQKEILPSNNMKPSVRKTNVANLPVQDCRSSIGLTDNAETTQIRMNKHQDKVMKRTLMKCTMLIEHAVVVTGSARSPICGT
jgi:hypothetical protein